MTDLKKNISLKPLGENDKEEFKQKIQESFGIAVKEHFGKTEKIPSDRELEEAFMDPQNEIYCIFEGNDKVGGAIIRIDPEKQRNFLEFFFIYAGKHSAGLGLAAWNTIEKTYPQAKVWETVTPYFEKRNIHFYVNKCGFRIIEFCNKHHVCQDEHYKRDNEIADPGTDEFFRFEKIIK